MTWRDDLFQQNEQVLEIRKRLNEEDYALISNYSNNFRMLIFQNEILQKELNSERTSKHYYKSKAARLTKELGV